MQETTSYLKCANCGKLIRWNDSFCSACGSKVDLINERATVDLPLLNSVVGKEQLWKFRSIVESSVEAKASCSMQTSSPSQEDSSLLQPKPSPSQETSPSQEDSSILQQETSPSQEDSSFLQQESSPSQEDSSILQQEPSFPSQEDSSLLQQETPALQQASSPSRHMDYISQKKEKTDNDRQPTRHTNEWDCGWYESWLMFYHKSPSSAIVLSTLVFIESFMFFPYVFAVLFVFQYNWICAVLTISGTTVLLTHAVRLCDSYCSIFTQKKNRCVEMPRAVEETQKLLIVGSILFSVFLLAFCIGLYLNDPSIRPSQSADVYVPATFDR